MKKNVVKLVNITAVCEKTGSTAWELLAFKFNVLNSSSKNIFVLRDVEILRGKKRLNLNIKQKGKYGKVQR